jgi:hypothetical protein
MGFGCGFVEIALFGSVPVVDGLLILVENVPWLSTSTLSNNGFQRCEFAKWTTPLIPSTTNIFLILIELLVQSASTVNLPLTHQRLYNGLHNRFP